jgi:hypothetical protein
MSIGKRYTLLVILVIIFVITAPVVVLYTAGYRYNFSKNKVEKTGILVIASEPRGAQISINGKNVEDATPARIKNLMPSNYAIRVEKDGFYPWEKTLTVKSKLTTFAENIMLFKKTLPMQVINGDIKSFSISNDGDKIAYYEKGAVKIFDIASKSVKELYKNSSEITSIVWSENDEKILVTERLFPNFRIVNADGNETPFLPKTLGYNFTELIFDSGSANTAFGFVLTGAQTGMLHQIDLKEKKIKASRAIGNSFIAEGDKIYTIELAAKNKYLLKKSFKDSAVEEQITLMPYGNYKFLELKNDLMTVLHKERGELVYINFKNSDENTILESDARTAIFTKDLGKLIIKKDFEILVYDFAAKQKDLITRYGKEIKKAIWHPEGGYLFFNLDKTLEVIELDNRGGSRSQISLTQFDEIRDFAVDSKGEVIYFTGKIGAQQGLFELDIK